MNVVDEVLEVVGVVEEESEEVRVDVELAEVV